MPPAKPSLKLSLGEKPNATPQTQPAVARAPYANATAATTDLAVGKAFTVVSNKKKKQQQKGSLKPLYCSGPTADPSHPRTSIIPTARM